MVAATPMKLRRNRYDPTLLLAQLDGQVPSRDADEWCLRFTCPHDQKDVDDFLVYLPKSQAEQPRAIALVREFVSQISKLDNLVQDSCEDEWARGTFEISTYKLHIAYMTPADDQVSVEYFGTIVNTQWTAVFKRAPSGEWEKANF
jgi:hypothetical protein